MRLIALLAHNHCLRFRAGARGCMTYMSVHQRRALAPVMAAGTPHGTCCPVAGGLGICLAALPGSRHPDHSSCIAGRPICIALHCPPSRLHLSACMCITCLMQRCECELARYIYDSIYSRLRSSHTQAGHAWKCVRCSACAVQPAFDLLDTLDREPPLGGQASWEEA